MKRHQEMPAVGAKKRKNCKEDTTTLSEIRELSPADR